MSNSDGSVDAANVVRALGLGVGGGLLVLALAYNEWTLGALASAELGELTRTRVRGVQLGFAATGLLLCGAVAWAGRGPAVAAALRRRGVAPIALVLAALLPFVVADCTLRPFVEAKTTLFERDPRLGWRMRPGAVADWGQVRVRVNERGLRGPAIPDARSPERGRVLFLGDSVTFGFGIADPADTYPFLVGQRLGDRLGRPVEVVNAGVGGYSPWQELAWLEAEGLGYAPDAIVVGFVLNDVTEKLALTRYGGRGEGWQLERTARGIVDRWLSGSGLLSVLRDGFARLRFGPDVVGGAAAVETEDVRRLVEDARRPEFERAWSITTNNLQRLFAVARREGIPALLVVFPYALQLEDPAGTSGPQQRLARFASESAIAQLDLLDDLAGDGLFLDASHLSAAGHARAAAAIAPRVAVLLEGAKR